MRSRTSRAVSAWVPDRLQRNLVHRPHPALGWTGFLVQLLGLAFLACAVARPQWGEEEIETETEGSNVILAIDTSRSMLAEDVEPNRLTRAQLACQDLIEKLPGEQIGVIAFAGRAFLQAPLTSDHQAVLETIQQLDTFTIARGGTNIAEAISIATETMEKSGSSSSGLIIFSDGDELEGTAIEAAREASEKGLAVVTIGVGTEFGAIIPNPDAGQVAGAKPYVTDKDGNVVKSQLGAQTLRALADASNGAYFHLSSTTLPIDHILKLLDRLERQTVEGDPRTVAIERYHWPLGIGLGLLLIGFLIRMIRPLSQLTTPSAPSAPSAALGIILILCGAPASDVHADQAVEAFEAGNFEGAIERYDQRLGQSWRSFQRPKLHLGKAAAAYQLGDFKKASESFGEALLSDNSSIQKDAHYGLGNALVRLGQAAEGNIDQRKKLLTDAIEHYQSVLEIDPDHTNAKHNSGIAQKLLDQELEEEKKQEEEQQEEDQEQQEKPDEKDEPKPEPEQKDQPKEKEKSPEEKEQEQQEKEEEQKEQDQQGRSGDEQENEGGQKQPEGEKPEEQDQDSNEPQDGGEGEEDQQGEESEQQPDQSKAGGSQGDQQDPSGGQQQEDPQQQQEGGEAPPEGDLQAAGGNGASGAPEGQQNQNQSLQPRDADTGDEHQENPDTGFSISRARALLKSYADEDNNVRRSQPQPQRETYKNW